MKKNQRQSLIRQLITEHAIGTQEELLNHLQLNGVNATQATISRDIRELKLVKIQDENKQIRYALFNKQADSLMEDRLRSAVKREVLRIQRIQFMIVVLTEKDGADVVTNWLDEVDYPEVAATIAGVDTFIVICRTEEEAQTFAEKLEQMRE
ncbi:ArgR family transcriptional regulator [Enterococcus mundtii]|uniref:arginine repressor n=1 Tax=Enterococcus TaxID=1350 RepID=UPI0004461C9F|nr:MULTISPECIES: ArgR family transcriptional regulator [Enterococcus]AZP92177.1 ArgR family transcriptional regulator [Enterococcus mundtii]EYT95725.1 ArgR family transcriptional regulator [Enterococcus mundtii CRL35]MDA9429742.1 Arginine pathway regulatory protein ArgR, repressor of arg regulon [Enterococcus mundtii 1A]MDK4211864.1 ArgR family transcriptional regulator [Enterococcus mundtii]MDO7879500.1 ArgR family transcriptional regulator [Enterococcus mundtii]